MKLFAIYIGGEHPKANIEVHDIRFVAADSIEATHALRAQWLGRPGKPPHRLLDGGVPRRRL